MGDIVVTREEIAAACMSGKLELAQEMLAKVQPSDKSFARFHLALAHYELGDVAASMAALRRQPYDLDSVWYAAGTPVWELVAKALELAVYEKLHGKSSNLRALRVSMGETLRMAWGLCWLSDHDAGAAGDRECAREFYERLTREAGNDN